MIDNDDDNEEHYEKEDSDIAKLDYKSEGISLHGRSGNVLILGMSTLGITKQKKIKGTIQ